MGDQQQPATTQLKDLKPNMELAGTVSRVELYGAFVNVGAEQEGLVHISMLKPGHVNRVADVVQQGQTVKVWVHHVDPGAGRLELTMVRPVAAPWRNLKPGTKSKGTVVRLEDYGVFVDIGAERPGLVHISEMSKEYVSNPRDVVSVGDEVAVVVVEVNRKKRQIRLSMKDIESVPAVEEEEQAADVALPTAMELALRTAMHDAKRPARPRKPGGSAKTTRKDQEDILQRTLKQRVRTT